MLNVLIQMFSYPFLLRAMIVGVLVSLCASLLGVSLELKRYSMIGDGLSHVGFGALAVATAVHAAPLAVAIPVVVAAAFLLLRLSESSKVKGDAAIALISTGALTIVLGMRLMGSLLISSLVIFPALTSMRVFQSFRCVVISSACLSIVCFLIGLLLSYAWSTPAGASVVCVNIAAYLLFWAFSLVRQRLRRKPMENA